MKRRPLFLVATALAINAALAACTQSPYGTRHQAPAAKAVPAPTLDHPNAYNYLPVVLGGLCSEAEYPLFAALNAQGLESTRPILEKLGIIRDYHLARQNGWSVDQGWLTAINTRFRLALRQKFDTPEGPRIAWAFDSSRMIVIVNGDVNGNQWATSDRFFLLTTTDYHVLTDRLAQTPAFARPVAHPASDSLTFEFIIGDMKSSTRICFTASTIEVTQIPER